VRSLTLTLSVTLAAGVCAGPPEQTLPTAADIESYYESATDLKAEITGNVAVITVMQSTQTLRRGGTLWAKVGPYVFLFTEQTHQLFEDHAGLAAVRVVTRIGNGTEVARALLARDELSGVLWRRSLNIAGQARRDGTTRVSLIEDLIRWGEAHTEYEYNEQYTRRR